MTQISALAVYCGSKSGNSPAFSQAARDLGREMATRKIDLVYGGGTIGIMGELANHVLAGGGEVIGVIPDFLFDLEVAHVNVTELIRVPNMHERKHTMFTRADGDVVLPGGLGTMEEFIEVLTWKQLQLHDRPIVVLNVEGCWDGVDRLVDDIIAHGFAHPKCKDLYTVVERVEDIFTALENAPEPGRVVLDDHL